MVVFEPIEACRIKVIFTDAFGLHLATSEAVGLAGAGALSSSGGGGPVAGSSSSPTGDYADAALLLRWYASVVSAAHAAMTHFGTRADASSATATIAARNALIGAATSLGLPLDLRSLRENLHVNIWRWEAEGRLSAEGVSASDRQLKVCRVRLSGLISQQPGCEGRVLGSLEYMDTFAVVSMQASGAEVRAQVPSTLSSDEIMAFEKV
jgi:hypothetical protein